MSGKKFHCMKKSRIFFIVFSVLFLFLLLSGGTIVFYLIAAPTTAQVSIQPSITHFQHLSLLNVVTTHPDLDHQQIAGARFLTATIKQSSVQTASGKGVAQAGYASGTIAMEAHLSTPYDYVSEAAGTTITGTDGITLVSDQGATAFWKNTVYFQAHVSSPGSYGNIPVGAFYSVSTHGSEYAVLVNTTPLTGGQNAGPYSFVQQKDITAGEQALTPKATQSALAALHAQMLAGETWIEAPVCATISSSDKAVNERVKNFQVLVTATCTGEVYNTLTIDAVADQQFTALAYSRFGANYQLLGEVATTLIKVQVLDKKEGSLTVSLTSQGRWVYQFSAAEKQAMARIISDKGIAEARQLLLRQANVEGVTISTMYGFWIWNTIPANINKITITVLPIK
jgi:hypothetical protein